MINELHDFETYLKEQDASPASIAGYLSDLKKFARWYEATTGKPPQPGRVISLDIIEFRGYLQNAKQKAATINRALASLSIFFSWAIGIGDVSNNPVSGVKYLKQEKTAPKWLDKYDQSALLRAVMDRKKPSLRDFAIITLLIHAGLRVSESCRLDLGDVTLLERSGSAQILGKGNKYRDVPLNITARKALKDWLDKRGNAPGPLFTSQKKGGRLTPKDIQLLITRYAAHIMGDGANVTPHTLRHTFCKALIDRGVSIDQVAALAGHGNINTTARYTKPSQKDLQRAVQKTAWE
jgi:integrase/recombinase XerC